MKINQVKKILAVAALASTLAVSGIAAAAEEAKPSLPVAVVDVQLILEKAAVVTKVREQIDKKAEDMKKEFTKKEDYFKKKHEDLEKQKTVLSKEAFDKKNEELQKELADTQKKVQENRGSLDKANSEATQKFETALMEVVKDEAKKSNIKLVVFKGQTLYADETLDITTKVLEGLNKKLPSIDVKF